jgi:predicted amidohydrolase
MKKLKVASVQFEHADGEKAKNFEKINKFAAEAKKLDAELVVFPECCISGYTFLRDLSREELLTIAERVPNGPSTQELIRLSVENEMIVGAGLVEVDEDGQLFNTYVVALPDSTHYSHRKLHCFISPHMASGSEFLTFTTPQGWRVGVLICYDCNLNENVRLLALQGIHLLLAPHQTGGFDFKGSHGMGPVSRQLWDNRGNHPTVIEAEFRGEKGREWLTTWLPARAYDNGIFIVFSNGVGVDSDEIRTGNSMIIDPYGRILSETWKADETMVLAELDPSLLENTYGATFIKTRRPELYADLSRTTGDEKSIQDLYQNHLRPPKPDGGDG